MPEQLNNISQTAEKLVDLIIKGQKVVLTHGNGPQVSNIMIQQEAGRDQAPAPPLEYAVPTPRDRLVI